MRVSLIFGPQGASLYVEPESREDKALLTAFGIFDGEQVQASVSRGASPFDVYGEQRTDVTRIRLERIRGTPA